MTKQEEETTFLGVRSHASLIKWGGEPVYVFDILYLTRNPGSYMYFIYKVHMWLRIANCHFTSLLISDLPFTRTQENCKMSLEECLSRWTRLNSLPYRPSNSSTLQCNALNGIHDRQWETCQTREIAQFLQSVGQWVIYDDQCKRRERIWKKDYLITFF